MNKTILIAALKALVDIADSHIEDVKSGIDEGIYEAEENLDLPEKNAHMKVVEQYLAALEGQVTAEAEFFEGYIAIDGIHVLVSFQAQAGASITEKDAAFLAALAQVAEINYLAIGSAKELLTADVASQSSEHEASEVTAVNSAETVEVTI